MFTVEIKINGTLIAHVHGHNTGRTKGESHIYDWHYYSTEKADVVSGNILHNREQGINALVARILTKVYD